ncbi:4-hydroxy-3-methylbut-2-en-1-yl diphosphate synthase [Natranaerovirga hydrolytica]|uniref:4-hydroxy-3-methylbut-2-en-1-yl diphosphate synthase (flavodoxin) n=1 Tax=Natranaerovirga hydrolytica TaxID=680378 RepID=A0A4R1MZE6_9FIRM|nr:flavodoxin-dependent (E)-4-hydroxy-3-methylbut-2-enyl-diphosphate synthase [Natranaerovirga hydrolytica]TCK97932.1 4-hydroxy-3-methylbut-2-en-1-yl diphosphate synthase [Natranaerovirga hydrolytica]
MRNNTKIIQIGQKKIGGHHPILIQSMTNTKTEDVQATTHQILELEKAGCDIIRVAVPNEEAAKAIEKIKNKIHIPIVADIHFDYRLALQSMEYGADKIRINPGNIGSEDRIVQVIQKAKEKEIPIRVGVNSGSLEKEILAKYNTVTAEGLVESAINKIKVLERYNYDKIVVSIKSSNVLMSIKAHELISQATQYPLHIGITEAGTLINGAVKSSVGMGIILYNGMGNTIRVSLTGDPIEEIKVGKQLLKTLGLRDGSVELISCPTCGRTQIDLIELTHQVEKVVESINKNIKIAVMGCVVNGPGEAKEADLGVAGGKGEGLIFKKGQIIRKVKENELLKALEEEIKKL